METLLDGRTPGTEIPPPASEFLNAPPEGVFDQMARVAEETKPELPDENEPRYGVSLVFDINVANRNVYNAFGNFEDMNFLPRLALIPFYTRTFKIPAELRGGTIEGDDVDELINQFKGAWSEDAYTHAMATNVISHENRSSKKSAEIFRRDYGTPGKAVFGADILDPLQNLDYKEGANLIYGAVLPHWNQKIFPERSRTVLGYNVEGPFLDTIIRWLKDATGAQAHIKMARFDSDYSDRAEKVRTQLLALAMESSGGCHAAIGRKNDLIQKGQANGYDEPNYRQPDAPKPPDLIMLAMVNVPPIQEKDIAIAKKFAEGAASNAAPQTAEGVQDIVNAAVAAALATALPQAIAQTREAVLAEVGIASRQQVPPVPPLEQEQAPPAPPAAVPPVGDESA